MSAGPLFVLVRAPGGNDAATVPKLEGEHGNRPRLNGLPCVAVIRPAAFPGQFRGPNTSQVCALSDAWKAYCDGGIGADIQ